MAAREGSAVRAAEEEEDLETGLGSEAQEAELVEDLAERASAVRRLARQRI